MDISVVITAVGAVLAAGAGGGWAAYKRVRILGKAEVESTVQKTMAGALEAQRVVNDELRLELSYRDKRIAEQDKKIDALEKRVQSMRTNLDELEDEIKHLRSPRSG